MTMCIDIRCRPPCGQFLDYFNAMIAADQRPRSFAAASMDLWFDEMRQAGITQAVAAGGINAGMHLGRRAIPPREIANEHVAAVVAMHPDRIIGIGGVDPSGRCHDPVEEVGKCAALGLKGVFLEPGRALPGCHPADSRLYPVYEALQRNGLCLNLQTSGPLGGDTIDYAHPRHIDRIAADFPDLRIICCHGCYPYVREIIAVCMRREHVFVAPDVYLRWPGTQDWVDAINFRGEIGQGRFEDHFIFGTAYPYMDLVSYMNFFNSLPINEAAKGKILRGNALRALRLDPESYPDTWDQ